MSMPSPTRDCILCGRCLSVCPVFLATGKEELSPKAKHQLLKTLADSPESLRMESCRTLADMCLGCGRCLTACTQGLSVPKVLGELRAQHPEWRQWVWKTWIEKGTALWPLMASLGKLAPQQGPESVAALGRSLSAMGKNTTLSPWLAIDHFDTDIGKGKTAMLFSGCTAKRVQKGWQKNATTILESLGFTCIPETETACCGLTLEHAGLPHAASKSCQKNIEAWRAAGRPLLIAFCATCLHGLKSYIDYDLPWEKDEREIWQQSVRPLSSLWGKTTFTIRPSAPESIAYHQPCHQEKNDTDKTWLTAVLADRLYAPSGPHCCGMGGILQLSNRKLSEKVSAGCWQNLQKEHPQQVITGCSGCTVQLKATAPEDIHVAHWLEILAL